MKINYYFSDDELQKEFGNRIKSVRIDMEMTQGELALQAGVSPRTVSNLETGKDVSFKTVIDVLRALGYLQNMDLLLPEQMIRPSQLVENGKPRERAPRKKRTANHSEWKWGDEQ